MNTTATILVVDDDPWIRDVLAATLREEGYNVLLAADGLEAFLRIEQQRPALILLDVMMPRMNGVIFAEELRHRHPDLSIPVLLVSAGQRVHLVADSIGADGYLAKPFDLQALLDEVARLVHAPLRARA